MRACPQPCLRVPTLSVPPEPRAPQGGSRPAGVWVCRREEVVQSIRCGEGRKNRKPWTGSAVLNRHRGADGGQAGLGP